MEKATVECPSHQIQVTQVAEGTQVELVRGAFLDRDFILNLTELKNQSFCIVTPDPQLGPEGCTVLASFCPPMPEVSEKNPVELKILVDCSGSMEGDSISSAKRALHQVLSQLDPHDHFSYSCFGSEVQHHHSRLKPANQFNITATSVLISNTKADLGGTETAKALVSTFDIKSEKEKADVLLITDGEVWDTGNIVKIAQMSGHRIFAIGVGTAPADTLLQELAEKTSGACELISPKENIAAAILRMFNRMRLARSTEIKLEWGQAEKPTWITGNNRAIFFGNTVHVMAGFTSAPKQAPVLSYLLGESPQRIEVSADKLMHDITNRSLSRLGAAQRLKSLPKGDKIALALQYQLVTEDTNCLLVHVRAEKEKAEGLPELQKIAQMQVAGWGGAGTVHDSTRVYAHKAMVFRKAAGSGMLNSAPMQDAVMPSYDALDVPKVFRAKSAASQIITDEDHHGIPEFLIKRKESIRHEKRREDPLSPEQIIQIANHALNQKSNLAFFIREIKDKELWKDILVLIKKIGNRSSHEDAWIIVLSWMLFKLENEIEWNEDTKKTIESLATQMDPNQFRADFEVVSNTLKNLTPTHWD
jgi:Ca-activated chloride channel family protein